VIRYLIRRILWACVLFIAVTIVTYLIFFIIPADPAKLAAGKSARPEDVARARHFLGLDKPVYWQYGKFVGRLIGVHWKSHGGDIWRVKFEAPSLGESFANRQSVNSIVARAAPVTATLVFGGVILWLLISLPVGILSALRPRSVLDRASMTFVLIGISAHPVWIGLIFSYFIGYKWRLTPITGYCDFFPPANECGGPVQWAYHMILPWMTYSILFAALYARMIRANVLEALNEDYVRTARAKGAPEWIVLRSHVLRNALLPVVTMLGMDIGLGLAGAVFTERVYSLPGLGLTTVTSLNNLDLPTVEGIVVFATVAIIVFNLAVDLIYAVIDPRIRLA
jgi:peptide/nickel transport system permease protein